MDQSKYVYFKTFQEIGVNVRRNECKAMLNKYPDRIPVLVDIDKDDTSDLKKHKMLVPRSSDGIALLHAIRKCNKLKPDEAFFMFIDNKLMVPNKTLSEMYKNGKHEDGFLYVYLVRESTFG